MKVVLFIEGCYPYFVGGVSTWTHSLIESMPDVEFVVQTIIVDKKQMGKFVYQLPSNVTAVHEIALYDDDEILRNKKVKLTKNEKQMITSLISGERTCDWSHIFAMFRNHPDISINKLLMGKDFMEAVISFYNEKYEHVVFSDFLWTLRSLFLPLLHLLKCPPIKADLYHSFSTGYAGVLGGYAKDTYPQTPYIVTEHGIYTREREEEIIKTDWTKGIYKDIWISNFYKQSYCAYHYADKVISLFEHARELQIEMECPPDKTLVIANGIDVLSYDHIPGKSQDDPNINIGAVVRVTPIKDVKTMINAFSQALKAVPNLNLYIMGSKDENPEYFAECQQMAKNYGLEDKVIFTGNVTVKEYIGKMDFLLLTSISESQPLVLLEGMSAEKPCIATNVGCCSDIINGIEGDSLGACGIITPIMQIDKISRAIVTLATNKELRDRMGKVGRARVMRYYRQEQMYRAYSELYHTLPNETVSLEGEDLSKRTRKDERRG